MQISEPFKPRYQVMMRTPVLHAVPPKKRDRRPFAERMNERVREIDESSYRPKKAAPRIVAPAMAG